MKDDHGCHRCGRSLSDCRCQQDDAAGVPRLGEATQVWPPMKGDRYLVPMTVASFGDDGGERGRWLRLDAVGNPNCYGTFAPDAVQRSEAASLVIDGDPKARRARLREDITAAVPRTAEATHVPDDMDEIKFSTRDLLAFRGLPRRNDARTGLRDVVAAWSNGLPLNEHEAISEDSVTELAIDLAEAGFVPRGPEAKPKCESCEMDPASKWCSRCIVEDHQAAVIARGLDTVEEKVAKITGDRRERDLKTSGQAGKPADPLVPEPSPVGAPEETGTSQRPERALSTEAEWAAKPWAEHIRNFMADHLDVHMTELEIASLASDIEHWNGLRMSNAKPDDGPDGCAREACPNDARPRHHYCSWECWELDDPDASPLASDQGSPDAGPARITHVAIRVDGVVWSLPKPFRHHNVVRLVADLTGATHIDCNESDGDQGFLDASGRYLTRKEALPIALANKQVKDENDIRAGMLFSEDVW